MATPENRRPQPPEEPETDYPWDYVKLHRVEQAFSNADREVNVYLRKKNLTIDSINEVSILPDDDVINVFSRYFTQVPVFMAENFSHNPYDQHLSEIGWSAFAGRTTSAFRGDVRDEAHRLGASQEEIEEMDIRHPAFVGATDENEYPRLLIPSEFVVNARQNPVDALAGGAYVLSQLRDNVNGLPFLENDTVTKTKARARATVAQFLNFVPEEDRFFVSQRHMNMLSEYPHGTYSLPNGYQYEGFYKTARDVPQDEL